jgi:hypothetical protein
MAIVYAADLRTARMTAVRDAIDAGSGSGKLKLYTSGDVLLATLTLADPCGTVSGSALTFSVIASDTSADASGTIAKATITTSADAVVITGLTVGTSSADIIMPSVAVVSGAAVGMTSLVLNHAYEEGQTGEGADMFSFSATYYVVAATNETNSEVPNFGKHQAWAYNPIENAAYVFGGDGLQIRGTGSISGGMHFGRLTFNSTPPIWDHPFPYWGVAGKVIPVGYDFAPLNYDSKRNCIWQIGGFSWTGTTGWVGIPERDGVWKFSGGEWTHVSSVTVPYSDGEQMETFYHPRLDYIIGLKPNRSWWYNIVTDARGSVGVAMGDGRNVGDFRATQYDDAKDEAFFICAQSGEVRAMNCNRYPVAVTSRVIATGLASPGSAAGQFPMMFIPSRRQLVLMYDPTTSVPKVINVDTGVVTSGPSFPVSVPHMINAGCYASAVDRMYGTMKDSNGGTVMMSWGGSAAVPVPTWLPASGSVASLGVSLLSSVDPYPVFPGTYQKGGFGNILDAWGGSAYAPELGNLGSILLFNGGDADYWGNEVVRFDFETRTWTRLSEPYLGIPVGSQNAYQDASYGGTYNATTGLHEAGQPAVSHNYDTIQWIPPSTAHPKGMLVNLPRINCYGTTQPMYPCYFDIQTRTWDIGPSARQLSGSLNTASTIYDSARGRIWYRGDGTQSAVAYVNTGSLAHTAVSAGSFVGYDHACSARDPVRDLWLTVGYPNGTNQPAQMQGMNLANPSGSFVTCTLSGPSLPLYSVGFDWCPDEDAGYAYFRTDPQAVYKFTPGAADATALTATWTVTRIALGGATISATNYETYSKWRWASGIGAFYLLTSINHPVWIYKP